jgi:hypothetical protein
VRLPTVSASSNADYGFCPRFPAVTGRYLS